MRPSWMDGCGRSLSGLHIYERGETRPTDIPFVKCRACGNKPALADAILEFIEEAEAQQREEAARVKRMQAAYLRAGKKA